MGLYNEYIKNISLNDIKNAASHKVHASYVFLTALVTWFLSVTSTMLTTIFISTLFIFIVNVAKTDSCKQDIDIMLSKFENDSESSDTDGDDTDGEAAVNESTTTTLNSNTLSNSVLENNSDDEEVIVDREEKKTN